MADKITPLVRRPTIRGLLQDVWGQLDERMIELRQGTGLDVVRPSDANLFMMICRHPRTISELARHRGVTRQSVHAAVQRLMEAGALSLEPVPGSKRDKMPVPTERGQAARRQAHKLVDQLEEEIAIKLGKEKLETLRSILLDLVE
ncbi:MarR family winged helix-turn-helix transcriptional regulator [Labrenzia sp. CE80]|uniref:MarR family winged helix-turn-helix transcriptional regulator n=1 Tax=Labrenzia sp. CE80 TaxID=1788986 RepID=UPI00129A4D54|nr:MarR family winged helix-turn-helix transcriptional regulator [Labrenzia sp. CE80]